MTINARIIISCVTTKEQIIELSARLLSKKVLLKLTQWVNCLQTTPRHERKFCPG